MHPFLLQDEGGNQPPTKCSKRECLVGSQFLEGVCWEGNGDLFQEDIAVLH